MRIKLKTRNAMRIEECAFCFRNPTSGSANIVEFNYKLFLMRTVKRKNECEQCARRRAIKIFEKHNASNSLAAISADGITVNWAAYIKILRFGEPERKYGATKMLGHINILSQKRAGVYGISLNGMVLGPVVNRCFTLYFIRKSDANEFARLAMVGGGADQYEIVEMKGAA